MNIIVNLPTVQKFSYEGKKKTRRKRFQRSSREDACKPTRINWLIGEHVIEDIYFELMAEENEQSNNINLRNRKVITGERGMNDSLMIELLFNAKKWTWFMTAVRCIYRRKAIDVNFGQIFSDANDHHIWPLNLRHKTRSSINRSSIIICIVNVKYSNSFQIFMTRNPWESKAKPRFAFSNNHKTQPGI